MSAGALRPPRSGGLPSVPDPEPDQRLSTGAAAPGRRSVFATLGAGWLIFGDGADFAWATLRRCPRALRRYLTEVLRQATILGSGSAMLIVALVFAFGLTIGTQAAYAAQLIGAPSVAALGTAIGDLREIVPYAFGYMMAARVGTGYVAEIGTMRITEELDALDVMGLDSIAYLSSTRLLAAWIVLPFLYGFAMLVAFVGSFIAVVLQVSQVSAGGYLQLFWKFQNPTDMVFSITKAMAMVTFVVIVGCYYGYKVRGGPVEVGTATSRSMIVNLIGIHMIGILGSQLFWGGSPNLPIGG